MRRIKRVTTTTIEREEVVEVCDQHYAAFLKQGLSEKEIFEVCAEWDDPQHHHSESNETSTYETAVFGGTGIACYECDMEATHAK